MWRTRPWGDGIVQCIVSMTAMLGLALSAGCGDSREARVARGVSMSDFASIASERSAASPLASRAEVGVVAAPVSPPADVRVMSVNARVAIFIDGLNHWSFRKGTLVRAIREFDPDVLGTQECLAGQSDYLRSRLHDYDFVGAGRNDGARRGEMCGVFFRRSRYERLDHGHFWLSETPQKPGSKSWGTSVTRMATWVKLRDRATGRALCFFNTHLDHISGNARAESAELLNEKIAAIAGDLPVVLCGDFNAGEGSTPYRTLTTLGEQPLVDTFRAANPASRRGREGTRHDFFGGRGGARIDWILASRAFATVAADIVQERVGGRYPSDHFPVTAILRPIERDDQTATAPNPRGRRFGG